LSDEKRKSIMESAKNELLNNWRNETTFWFRHLLKAKYNNLILLMIQDI
jgi:hypothetical protein